MLVISAEEQRQTLTMLEAIDAVAVALSEYSEGRALSPVRMSLPTSKTEGTSLFMPSLVESNGALGVKFVSVFPGNKKMGKKTIYGVMVISDVETGEPLAMLEGSYLTILRTGAVSGLATKHLSNPGSSRLCVIGTGRQASGLIDAILSVRDIRELCLYNRTQHKADELANEIRNKYKNAPKINIFQNSDQATEGADIIVTATNSHEPVITENSIKKGMHINAVGAFKTTMQEIPSSVLTRINKVVVESRKAALEEAGDLVIPIKEGRFSPDQIYGELGEIVNQKKSGRQTKDEITLFKSVGLAAMDVVIAKKIYDRALEKGIGQYVSL